MLEPLATSYAPAPSEPAVRSRWDAAAAFHAEPGAPGKPYCILIPPPNVTAALHLGHAFTYTLQDVLIRYHRMRGFNTLWMPGTDHAGIATQAVVEKRLLLEGKRRSDLGREAFVARVQAWKDEYEATIIEQLKAMGSSCDWARVRFTMDPMCARAVRDAFFRLFADGLIYRGKRLVNWDPVTQTALADDEVEMEDVDGFMWYLRYPIEGSKEFVTVATTRPETMLGDTAVAISPRHPRATELRGRKLRLPIVDRVVSIVADEHVVMPGDDNPLAGFATGFLKVTPAHDFDDWEIGVRHGLPALNVLAPDATISADYGWRDHEAPSAEASAFLGLSREVARDRIVAWFKAHGLLERTRPYRHAVGHSYRSHVPVEPYLSDQWYVRVSDDRMRGEALRAMSPGEREGPAPPGRGGGTGGAARPGDGVLRFFPARYARTFQAWHENLRDWCISRQLWWGHRIPVWSREFESAGDLARWKAFAAQHAGQAAGDFSQAGLGRFSLAAGAEDLQRQLERGGFVQDPDVLDTWFSSGLWPLSTMGWPQPRDFPETAGLLETFNPTSVLCTGRDIITLWVSRMVMFNRYFRGGTLPFAHVFIHPMIQDGHGQRMSKSLGNGVDPRDIIHSHGADAMRFVLVQMATGTQDCRLPVDVVCPRCAESFKPAEASSPAGYKVAAARQACPHCGAGMASAYGAASGEVTPGSDLPLARNTSRKFDEGRNFANKLWNVTRFALRHLQGDGAAPERRAPARREGLLDRWIVSRLCGTCRAVDAALAEYQFNAYADAMYDFVWRDFCDWYVEAIKPTVDASPDQQQVLRTVLNAALRLLHPVCPFVTEALWPHVQAAGAPGLAGVTLAPPRRELLATAPWPQVDESLRDPLAEAEVGRLQELTKAIRNLRTEHAVPPRSKLCLLAGGAALSLIRTGQGTVEALAGIESVAALDHGGDPPGEHTAVPFEGEHVYVAGLAGAVDPAVERKRLHRQREALSREVERFRARLGNESYVAKAPASVVEDTRRRQAEAEANLKAAERALAMLGEE